MIIVLVEQDNKITLFINGLIHLQNLFSRLNFSRNLLYTLFEVVSLFCVLTTYKFYLLSQ